MSHEAISNEIFQHFRSEQKKIDNALFGKKAQWKKAGLKCSKNKNN
jgi:hypothetical protein